MKKKYLLIAPILVGALLTGCSKVPDADPVSREELKANISKTKEALEKQDIKEKGLRIQGSIGIDAISSDTSVSTKMTIDAIGNGTNAKLSYGMSATTLTTNEDKTQDSFTFSVDGNTYAFLTPETYLFAIDGKLSEKTNDENPLTDEMHKKATGEGDFKNSGLPEEVATLCETTLKEISKEFLENLETTFTGPQLDPSIKLLYGEKHGVENYTLDAIEDVKLGNISLKIGQKVSYIFDKGLLSKIEASIFVGEADGSKSETKASLEFSRYDKAIEKPDLSKYDLVDLDEIDLPTEIPGKK